MKYDDASWHFDGKGFPKDLPHKAAATHIGMFVAWMVLNDLVSDEFRTDWSEQIQMLKAKQITPGQFVWQYMDGKFSQLDLSEKGRMFADVYYKSEVGESYLKAYEMTVKGDLPSEYLLSDTWQTYARASEIIDIAYQSWLGT